MKKITLLSLLLTIALTGCTTRPGSDPTITFMVASDMGRTGVSEQQNIANLMARFAEENTVDFLVVAGDPIHDQGVTCVNDEEWDLKIESVYTAPSLHAIPWYVISGNHEYNGSIQAILDYSNVSERWHAPARYFAKTQRIGSSRQSALFVFIDTSPLIDKYRYDEPRSDAAEQDIEAQLRWLDSVLMVSNDRWKIVIGHHPVYAATTKQDSERTDMQQRVGTILDSRGADFYICGHIHNFQHIQPEGSKVNHIVNSSASRSRPVHDNETVVFGSGDPGFSTFSVSRDGVRFAFVNHTGETVYSYSVGK